MKKLGLYFGVVVLSALIFSGCTVKIGSRDKVAEDEVVEPSVVSPLVDAEDVAKDPEIEALNNKIKELEDKLEKPNDVEVEPEGVVDGGVSFIDLKSPNDEQWFDYSPIIFTGNVSKNTEKIVVKATGGTKGYCDVFCAPYYEDTYTLKDFKLGDTAFTYRARRDWKNLTETYNTYVFTAYFVGGSTSTDKVSVTYDPSRIVSGGDGSKGAIYDIRNAFQNYSGINEFTLFVDDNVDNKHAVGRFSANGGNGRFWAKKVSGQWTIAASGQDSVSCADLAGFPAAFREGCY